MASAGSLHSAAAAEVGFHELPATFGESGGGMSDLSRTRNVDGDIDA